jgi:hypothetical protein
VTPGADGRTPIRRTRSWKRDSPAYGRKCGFTCRKPSSPERCCHGKRIDVGPAAVRSEVEDRHDARVSERRRGARLAVEALAESPVSGELGNQHLEGDVAPEPPVAGAVDLSHPALAERWR